MKDTTSKLYVITDLIDEFLEEYPMYKGIRRNVLSKLLHYGFQTMTKLYMNGYPLRIRARNYKVGQRKVSEISACINNRSRFQVPIRIKTAIINKRIAFKPGKQKIINDLNATYYLYVPDKHIKNFRKGEMCSVFVTKFTEFEKAFTMRYTDKPFWEKYEIELNDEFKFKGTKQWYKIESPDLLGKYKLINQIT